MQCDLGARRAGARAAPRVAAGRRAPRTGMAPPIRPRPSVPVQARASKNADVVNSSVCRCVTRSAACPGDDARWSAWASKGSWFGGCPHRKLQ